MAETFTLNGFADRSRHHSGPSMPTYAKRRIQLHDPVVRDINCPDCTFLRQTRRPEHIQTKRKLARTALSNLIGIPCNTYATPETLPAMTTTNRLVKFLKFLKPNNKWQLTTSVAALLIIAVGAGISLVAYQNNNVVHAQAAKLTTEANKAATSSANSTANNALSTVKPTPKTVAAYAVAPGYPKYLKIPAIGVDTIIGQTGILANGALGTPSNVFYTDWYTGSAEPGQPGATLIDGHVSSWTSKGVFYNLHKLQPGDAIQIVKGDNSIVNYQVVKTQVYSSNNVNMQAAITPVDPTVSGLNLITCTGQVIKGTSQFNERVIVFAKEI